MLQQSTMTEEDEDSEDEHDCDMTQTTLTRTTMLTLLTTDNDACFVVATTHTNLLAVVGRSSSILSTQLHTVLNVKIQNKLPPYAPPHHLLLPRAIKKLTISIK